MLNPLEKPDQAQVPYERDNGLWYVLLQYYSKMIHSIVIPVSNSTDNRLVMITNIINTVIIIVLTLLYACIFISVVLLLIITVLCFVLLLL